jgi:hypothetical protein
MKLTVHETGNLLGAGDEVKALAASGELKALHEKVDNLT